MENGEKTIFGLFTGEKKFIIPKYQRAYAWEDRQRKDFLEDIKNQREDKDYFLGTILVQDRKEIKDGFEQIYIVDGQQRVTTIVIFMKVLLSTLGKKDKTKDYDREIRRYLKDKDAYKLEIMHTDNEFFKTYIIDDNPMDEKAVTTPSQKRLCYTKRFFEEKLSGLDVDSLKKYMAKVEKSKVLTYSVIDNAEATLIFETTNDRGKTLTNLEKTKSFLMHKIYLTKEKASELIDSIQDRFSAIYRIMEDIETQIEDEDSILKYHFISHFDWKSTQKTKDYQVYVPKMKEKINQLMKSDNGKEVPQFIDNYSRELKETFEVVQSMLKDGTTHVRDLFILERISLFFPLMIKCHKFDKSLSKKDYYEIIRLIEIFSLRVYGVGNRQANTGTYWLYNLAKDFEGDFNKLKVELKDKINEYVNEKYFKEKLSSSRFYEDISELKYILWKYENHLRKNEQPVASEMSESEFANKDPKFKLTVEHIASQHPRVSTSELILPKLDEDFQENFLHRLGNLTFDPNSANASKGNNDIQVKKSKYFLKAPFKTQNELDTFIANNKWTKESIAKREEKIISFALSYWNPEVIYTEAVKEIRQQVEDEVSESKEEHRHLIKQIAQKLNKDFKVWNVSKQAKRANEFKTYQTRTGNLTSFYTKWAYDKAEFCLEGGLWKEEPGPFKCYVQFYTRKKSERVTFNVNDPEIQEILQSEGYEKQPSIESKIDYLKTIELTKISQELLTDKLINVIQKIKPVIEKILSD